MVLNKIVMVNKTIWGIGIANQWRNLKRIRWMFIQFLVLTSNLVWSRQEQLLEDLGKKIQETSQKLAINSEASQTWDNSVEPQTPSATIEVQMPTYVALTFVQELIIEPNQQCLKIHNLMKWTRSVQLCFLLLKKSLHPSWHWFPTSNL